MSEPATTVVPLASVADVERRRPLTTTQRTVAAALVEEATALLALAVPGLRARAQGDPDVRVVARSVVCSMVLRVVLNPDLLRQFTVDDATSIRDQAASAGLLYVHDVELQQLDRRGGEAANTPGAGAYVIRFGS